MRGPYGRRAYPCTMNGHMAMNARRQFLSPSNNNSCGHEQSPPLPSNNNSNQNPSQAKLLPHGGDAPAPHHPHHHHHHHHAHAHAPHEPPQGVDPSHEMEGFEELPVHTDFGAVYELGEKVGTGTYATVHACVHRKSQRRRAVKIICLHKMDAADLEIVEEEINILRSLHHPFIVRLYHVFRNASRIYIVQELCRGGELFDSIVERKRYSEQDARQALRAILEAVSYAHGHGIVHRDLKPENILLVEDGNVKLADFGMSHRLLGLEPLHTVCGSPGYMAPEIVKAEDYDEKVDVWASGAILFCLLAGYQPFADASTPMLLAKIKHGYYNMRHPVWREISSEAKDLVRHMLVVDPAKRLTARACLEHKWFAVSPDALAMRELPMTRNNLQHTQLRGKHRFRAAAEAIIMANRLKVLSLGQSLSGEKSHYSFRSSSSSSIHSLDSSGSTSTTGSLSSSSGQSSSTLGASYDVAQHLFPPKRQSSINNASSGGWGYYSCTSSPPPLDSPVKDHCINTMPLKMQPLPPPLPSQAPAQGTFDASTTPPGPGLRGLNEWYEKQRARKKLAQEAAVNSKYSADGWLIKTNPSNNHPHQEASSPPLHRSPPGLTAESYGSSGSNGSFSSSFVSAMSRRDTVNQYKDELDQKRHGEGPTMLSESYTRSKYRDELDVKRHGEGLTMLQSEEGLDEEYKFEVEF